eukprot:11163467-Ditylum_brightwellii.AAC.1
MSNHSTETPMTYLHCFTTAVNKLCAAVSPGEAIQVPPTHMLPYYLVDGLRYPELDFLQILSDLKKNTGNVKDYMNSTGDLSFTLKKAMEHAASCKEIKGVIQVGTPRKKPALQQPQPQKEIVKNPTLEQFKKELSAGNSKQDEILVIKKYLTKSESGGCSIHPTAKSHPFLEFRSVKNACQTQGLQEELQKLALPVLSTPPP